MPSMKPSKGGVTDSAEDPGSDDMREDIRHTSPVSDDMREDIRHKSRRVRILVGMGMSVEDASELEEEERRRGEGGRRRSFKEAEELEKKRRRQWSVEGESEEEKERKETQEGLGDATVDGGSARVEDVREEDKAITRSLNISDSNLACVRRRVDRVEEEMEDLRNMVKGMTIDGGGQVERAQARTVEEPKSHDGIAARMDKRGTKTACKECGKRSVRDKYTQTPNRRTSWKFTQTPKTSIESGKGAYKGPVWQIGQLDGVDDEEEETSEEEDGSEEEESEMSPRDQEKKKRAWTVGKALRKLRSLVNIGLKFSENGIRVKNLGREMAGLVGKERATLREVMEELLDIADHCTDHIKNELERHHKISLEVAGARMGMSALKSLVETLEEGGGGSTDGGEEEVETKNQEEVAPDEKSDAGEVEHTEIQENTELRDVGMEEGERAVDAGEISRDYYTKAERKKYFEEERDSGSESELSKSEEDNESIVVEEEGEEDVSGPDDDGKDKTYEPGSGRSSETEGEVRESLSENEGENQGGQEGVEEDQIDAPGEEKMRNTSLDMISPKSPVESSSRDSEEARDAVEEEDDPALERKRKIKDLRYNTGRETVRRGRIDKDGRFVWTGRWKTQNNNPEPPGEHKPCPSCGKPQPTNKSMKRHINMCERKMCGQCGVHVNQSSLTRHIKRIHSDSEEAKELERQTIRSREVGRSGRRRSKNRVGDDKESCKECGKLVLWKNMPRHILSVHDGRGRRMTVKGRRGDRPREVPGEDGEVSAVEEEKKAGTSAREEEEKSEQPKKKKKRLNETQCKLCVFSGTDDQMTCHIMSNHVTPPKEP